MMAKRANYLRTTGSDLADINRDTIKWFERIWPDLDQRLTIVPGKEVIRDLRTHINETLSVSLTDARIIDVMHRDEVPSDLQDLLSALDTFRTTSP
jgi:hypothetical protein